VCVRGKCDSQIAVQARIILPYPLSEATAQEVTRIQFQCCGVSCHVEGL
jgi:hypothetical protein